MLVSESLAQAEQALTQDCCALASPKDYQGEPCAPELPNHQDQLTVCSQEDIKDPPWSNSGSVARTDMDKNLLLYSAKSPLGITVDVYSDCSRGICSCVYTIGGVQSQLRPCRFASLILCSGLSCASKYVDLLWHLTDGFPIVDKEVHPYECENYSSITSPDNKQKMDEIIKRELGEGCVSLASEKPICVHSLGAVPKGEGKIGQITDCSRPVGVSVNYCCDTLLEEFCFKSIADAVDLIKEGSILSVVDIKAAYRAVPIREEHRKFQGFIWELDGVKKYYVDNRLCFGLRLGPSYFNYISCFVYDVLSERYGLKIVNYLDDFLIVSDSLENSLVERGLVLETLRFLGFHVAYDKLIYPSKAVTYLGIVLDTDRMELRLPEGKLTKLKGLLKSHLYRKRISKKDLESIAGLLSHCSQLVKGGRIFCKSTYELYKVLVTSNKRYINLSENVVTDFNWWLRLFPFFNGTVKMWNPEFEYPMISDSSMRGFGVYLDSDWVAGTWLDTDHISLHSECNHIGFRPVWDRFDHSNINELELWPIVVGLKRWLDLFRDRNVHVFTDNTQVMFMLINGVSSNPTCRQWLKEIFWLCAIYNIKLSPKYVSTKSNLVADTLSRLPYFKSESDLVDLLNGSNLCCLSELFMAYRREK